MEDLALAAVGDRMMESRTAEYRKVVKPLLEKRRRARMNNSLNELKAFIVDAKKSEISDPSKLEKADILELTVRYLRELRRHQRHLAACVGGGATAEQASRFCAGFTECAHEVSLFLAALPGLEGGLRARLLTHVGACLTQVDKMAAINNNNNNSNSNHNPPAKAAVAPAHPHPYNQPYPLQQRPLRGHTPSTMPRPPQPHSLMMPETGFKVPHLPPSSPDASFKVPQAPSPPPPPLNPIHPAAEHHVTSLRDGFGPILAFGQVACLEANDVTNPKPEAANQTINNDDVDKQDSEADIHNGRIPSSTPPPSPSHSHNNNATCSSGLAEDWKNARSPSPVWRPW